MYTLHTRAQTTGRWQAFSNTKHNNKYKEEKKSQSKKIADATKKFDAAATAARPLVFFFFLFFSWPASDLDAWLGADLRPSAKAFMPRKWNQSAPAKTCPPVLAVTVSFFSFFSSHLFLSRGFSPLHLESPLTITMKRQRRCPSYIPSYPLLLLRWHSSKRAEGAQVRAISQAQAQAHGNMILKCCFSSFRPHLNIVLMEKAEAAECRHRVSRQVTRPFPPPPLFLLLRLPCHCIRNGELYWNLIIVLIFFFFFLSLMYCPRPSSQFLVAAAE